jgi:hypothetical protein
MTQHYAIRNGGIVKQTEDEALAATALMPGEYARRLYVKHGLGRRFYPEQAWFVNLDTVTRVDIVEVRGADCETLGNPDYALTLDGRLLPTFYLFPVARHQKARLLRIEDDMGHCHQWAAPLRANSMKHWG